jgi:hypothetical protein
VGIGAFAVHEFWLAVASEIGLAAIVNDAERKTRTSGRTALLFMLTHITIRLLLQ